MSHGWRSCARIILATASLTALWGCGGARVAPEATPFQEATSPRAAGETVAGAEAQMQQALAYMREGQYGRAEGVLHSIVDSREDSVLALLNLGISYHRLGRLEEADLLLQRVLQADPESSVAYNELGVVKRKRGRFRQAQAAYQHALDLRPDYALAHLNLGILCDLYLSNPACAVRHYRAYLEHGVDGDPPVGLWIDDLKRRYPERQWSSAGGTDG